MGQDSRRLQLSEEQDQLLTAALLEKLQMTPEERIAAHESARELVDDLKIAGEKLRAKPQ